MSDWWQAELRSALIELGEVEHAMEDVMGLLQQVEADLQQFGDVYGDPRHIEVHLRKIQARVVPCFFAFFFLLFFPFHYLYLCICSVCAEMSRLLGLIISGRCSRACSLQQTHSPSQLAWFEGRRPLGTALHSSDEPGELLQ